MPDSKISELPDLTALEGRDILPVVERLGPAQFANKKVTINKLFSSVPSNTRYEGTLTVVGNTNLRECVANNIAFSVSTGNLISVAAKGVVIRNAFTPGSSNLDDASFPIGTISYDQNYLYIKVATNTIKRVALTSF